MSCVRDGTVVIFGESAQQADFVNIQLVWAERKVNAGMLFKDNAFVINLLYPNCRDTSE